MPPFDTPTVLVTRPRASSEAFVAALRAQAGPFHPVISPAFEIKAVSHTMPDFDVAIFSSRAAVGFAPDGAGRPAYCVGDATALDADQAGYASLSAKGALDDLVALILEKRPTGRLLHLRGETTVGDLCGILKDAGQPCEECVTYRKAPCAPTATVSDALRSAEAVVLPLFSAETVSIVESWTCDFSQTHVVTISAAVADAAKRLSPASITIAPEPNQAEMGATVARLIA